MYKRQVAEFVKGEVDDLETVWDIAEYLHDLGITGHREDPLTCPVARFLNVRLNEAFGSGYQTYVDADFVRIEDGYHEYEHIGELPLGLKIQAFIVNFDKLEYPDLLINKVPLPNRFS